MPQKKPSRSPLTPKQQQQPHLLTPTILKRQSVNGDRENPFSTTCQDRRFPNAGQLEVGPAQDASTASKSGSASGLCRPA